MSELAIAWPRLPAPKRAMLCWPEVRRILRISLTSESTVADAALAELAEAGEVAADLGRVDVRVLGQLLRGDRLLAHLARLGQHLEVAREARRDAEREALAVECELRGRRVAPRRSGLVGPRLDALGSHALRLQIAPRAVRTAFGSKTSSETTSPSTSTTGIRSRWRRSRSSSLSMSTSRSSKRAPPRAARRSPPAPRRRGGSRAARRGSRAAAASRRRSLATRPRTGSRGTAPARANRAAEPIIAALSVQSSGATSFSATPAPRRARPRARAAARSRRRRRRARRPPTRRASSARSSLAVSWPTTAAWKRRREVGAAALELGLGPRSRDGVDERRLQPAEAEVEAGVARHRDRQVERLGVALGRQALDRRARPG